MTSRCLILRGCNGLANLGIPHLITCVWGLLSWLATSPPLGSPCPGRLSVRIARYSSRATRGVVKLGSGQDGAARGNPAGRPAGALSADFLYGVWHLRAVCGYLRRTARRSGACTSKDRCQAFHPLTRTSLHARQVHGLCKSLCCMRQLGSEWLSATCSCGSFTHAQSVGKQCQALVHSWLKLTLAAVARRVRAWLHAAKLLRRARLQIFVTPGEQGVGRRKAIYHLCKRASAACWRWCMLCRLLPASCMQPPQLAAGSCSGVGSWRYYPFARQLASHLEELLRCSPSLACMP